MGICFVYSREGQYCFGPDKITQVFGKSILQIQRNNNAKPSQSREKNNRLVDTNLLRFEPEMRAENDGKKLSKFSAYV